MDEMEEYRRGIERRRADRRLKNGRRVWRDKKPKFFDTATVLMLLMLVGFGLLLLTRS